MNKNLLKKIEEEVKKIGFYAESGSYETLPETILNFVNTVKLFGKEVALKETCLGKTALKIAEKFL